MTRTSVNGQTDMTNKVQTSNRGHATDSASFQALPASLQKSIDAIISQAISEDIGLDIDISELSVEQLLERDITSAATIPTDRIGKAELVVKGEGVVCGLPIAARVFQRLCPSAEFKSLVEEGTYIQSPPQTIAYITGPVRVLLFAERTALNLMQRMSGVATVSRQYAEKVSSHGIKVLDTRKTTPGLRAVEKYAVQVGGGTNHRFGLFDAILIKDNHVSIAGGVTNAIAAARRHSPGVPVEVEVTNQAQLKEALDAGAEKILLDNMTPAQVKESTALVAGRAFIEVSGGVNLTTIESYAISGVNAISVGALTHSVRSLDISLEIEG